MIYLGHRLSRLDRQNFGVFVPVEGGGYSSGAYCYPHDAGHGLFIIRGFTEGEVLRGARDLDEVFQRQYEHDRAVLTLARSLDPELELAGAAPKSGLRSDRSRSACVGDHVRFGTFECGSADRYNWHIYEVMDEGYVSETTQENTVLAADGRVLMRTSSYGRSLVDSAEICRDLIRRRHRSTNVVDAAIEGLFAMQDDFIRAAIVISAHWDEVADLDLDKPAPKKGTRKKTKKEAA